jgi:hypothetical protein
MTAHGHTAAVTAPQRWVSYQRRTGRSIPVAVFAGERGRRMVLSSQPPDEEPDGGNRIETSDRFKRESENNSTVEPIMGR